MTKFQIAKHLLNKCLSPLNLRVEKARSNRIDGLNIFSDIRKLLKKSEPICFDIGANEGQTIAALIEEFARPIIWAFEPASEPFGVLHKKKLPASVHLTKAAMGENVGTVILNKFARSVFNSTLSPNDDPENPFVEREIVAREEVPLTTVDSFSEKNGIQYIDLLKIDTQGLEFRVLNGARQLMQDKRITLISLEINFVDMYERQSGRAEIEALLSDNGFGLVGYYEIARKNGCVAWCTALYSLVRPGMDMEYN